MVKKMLKSKSKRVPARKRYKIERKVREHNRKLRKQQKLEKGKGKKKKLVIVPGDCPFRDKIIAEAEQARDSIVQQRTVRREEAKEARKVRKDAKLAEKRGLTEAAASASSSGKSLNLQASTAPKATPLSFEALMKKAEERGYIFEKIKERKNVDRDPSLKAFYKEFQHVIKESDVIIQVLDARDPLGTRSQEAEDAVRDFSDKKLIMVLNKCDLVPVDNLRAWITYLRQTTGTAILPFKANTQKQKDRLGSGGASVNTSKQAALDTKKSIGVSDLLGLLGTWGRNAPGGITIGVIGMPNVGKSSIINSLKRSRACNVGNKPGVTRACQVVHLDSKIKLIDSPGVCFSKEKGESSMNLSTIISRVPKTTLMLQYSIPEFNTEEEFLAQVARKCGIMKKGGVPNAEGAEQKILHDWHTGQIRFFTEPPELSTAETTAAIVTDMAAPFSLDNWEPKMTLEPSDNEMESSDSEYEDIEDMEMDDDATSLKKSGKRVTFAIDTEKKTKKGGGDELSPDVKKKVRYIASKKETLKKFKKSKKKSTKRASELSDVLEGLNF